MSEIIHSTEALLHGPWLIGREKLMELDRILDSEWQKLLKKEEELIEVEVAQDISKYPSLSSTEEGRLDLRKRICDRYSDRRKRGLKIHLQGDRYAEVATFEDALRDPALREERPTGFSLILRAGNIECYLRLPLSHGYLQLVAVPETDEAAKGLYGAVQAWIDTVKPPIWQTIWVFIHPIGQWPFLALFAFLGWSYFYSHAPDSSTIARNQRYAEAVDLLHSGISPANQFKALELILSYASGSIPETRNVSIPYWFLWSLIGGFIYCIVLCFAPKTTLGIGKGDEYVKKWKWWMKWIGISVPCWIFLSIISAKFFH